MTISAEVDERALREIHLVAFQHAVQEAGVWSLMTAYNKVNGIYCGEQPDLIGGVLRGEWGFDGLVMNPAGFTYAGFALKDCIKGAALPYVEVHISSIAKRQIHYVLSDVAEGVITGFGMHSYVLGLDAMLEILRKRTANS